MRYEIKLKTNTNTFQIRQKDNVIKVISTGRRGLPGSNGADGAPGAQGPEGPQGPAGDPASNLVTSVNAKQGIVVINPDDLDDSLTTHKFVTAAQSSLIDSAIQPSDNISTLVNDAGFITDISSFDTGDLAEGSNLYFTNERVDDRVAQLIQGGTGISWSYNDGAGTLTPTVTLTPFSTTNLAEGSNLYYTNDRVDARIALQAGQNDGLATLGSDGKIPTSQLPALAITDTFVVANQSAMLALTAEVGDIAVRSDLNKTFILKTAGASTLGNWQELLTPTDTVLSVNGQTGAVSLTTSNITEGSNLYYTDARVQTYGDAHYQPLDSDLTTIAGLTATTNNFIVSVSSAWASRTPAQVRTTLGLEAGGVGDIWVEKAGDTLTGKLTFSVASDFALDLGSSGLKMNKLIIDGTPKSFTFPYVLNTIQPEAFIYLDSQFHVFRIGAQSPSDITSIAFELPNNSEYQDVMNLSKTAMSPASALNNAIVLGGSSNRWKGLYIGSDGINSNADVVLNSASIDITPAPSADVTESGIIATLTAGEALVFGDVVYFKSDGKMGKADADDIATGYVQAMALGTIANNATGAFLLLGFVRNDAWNWTVGGVIYLSTTAGGLTQTAPSGTDDVVNPVGIATHADRMLFRPNQAVGVAA